jgi:chaperone modulatory protein CbpM
MTDTDELTGELIDDEGRHTLLQLCELCGTSAETVIELVDHGVLTPEGAEPVAWRFSRRMLLRSRKAHRLQRDLDLNLPGLALCLDLLDESAEAQFKVRVL